MIRLNPRADMIDISVSGTLTGDDYDTFVPVLERLAEERGPLNLYIVLNDFSGWSPAGLWKDVKFDATHQEDMNRIAVVGESSWEEWGTRLSKPFFDAEMRFFTRDDADEARAWLRRD